MVLKLSEFKSSKRLRCLTKHHRFPAHFTNQLIPAMRELWSISGAASSMLHSFSNETLQQTTGHERLPQLQVQECFRILYCKLPSHGLKGSLAS
jgi:hypothetical protein